MIALLLGLVACAGAAPRYDNANSLYLKDLDGYFGDSFGDFNKVNFDNFDRHFHKTDFSKLFDNQNAAVEDNEYIITVPLRRYTENDIVVKANVKNMTIQADHNDDGKNRHRKASYRYSSTLPDNVDPAGGCWTYTEDVLKITFPLKKKQPTPVAAHSRKEIDHTGGDKTQDADVGITQNTRNEKEAKTNKNKNNKEANANKSRCHKVERL